MSETTGGLDLNGPPYVLSPAQLAKVLGIGERQARQFVNGGGIYSFRVGRRVLIPKAAVRKLLESGGVGEGVPS